MKIHYIWRNIIYAWRTTILGKFLSSYCITLVYCVFFLFFRQFVCLYKSKLIICYWKYSLLLWITSRMFWKSLVTSARINGLIESYLESQTDAVMGIPHLLSICQWLNKQKSQFFKKHHKRNWKTQLDFHKNYYFETCSKQLNC